MFDSRLFRTLCLSFLSIPTLWIFPVNTMAQAPSNPGRAEPAAEDPYEWLEEVLGDKALEWVKARNAIVQNRMEGEPSFEKLRSDLLEILDSNARIPFVSKRGEYYYNFWRDKTNERGLWRRTTLEEYRKAEPKWEVVLDLDALGKTENENWVWKGASLLRPDYQRALITLSRGGADANITREFDLKTRSFVVDGFELPESKGSVSWIDIDHLFVSTDFGDASMTDSGYPRMAKLWKRGTPIEQAKLVYEGKQEDMSVGAVHDDSPGFERNFVTRNIGVGLGYRYVDYSLELTRANWVGAVDYRFSGPVLSLEVGF